MKRKISQIRALRPTCGHASLRTMASVPSVINVAPPGGMDTLPAESRPSRRSSTHYFDTFHVVTRLETAGFEHGQAVAAMNAIRALLVNSTEIAKAEMLSKAELENVRRSDLGETKVMAVDQASKHTSFVLPCQN